MLSIIEVLFFCWRPYKYGTVSVCKGAIQRNVLKFLELPHGWCSSLLRLCHRNFQKDSNTLDGHFAFSINVDFLFFNTAWSVPIITTLFQPFYDILYSLIWTFQHTNEFSLGQTLKGLFDNHISLKNSYHKA